MSTAPVTTPSIGEIKRNAFTGFSKMWPVYDGYESGYVVIQKNGQAEGAYTESGVHFLSEKDARVRRQAGAVTRKILRPRGTIRRLYFPSSEPGLIEEFALVEDEATLRTFAARFGLLGFQHIEENCGGDPIDSALTSAREARAVLQIIALLRAGHAEQMKRKLPQIVASTGRVLGVSITFLWPRVPAMAAWQCLQSILNPALRRIHPTLPDVADVLAPRLGLDFDALVDIVFYRIATEANGLFPFTCKQCQKLSFGKRPALRETCSSKCRMAYSRNRGESKPSKRG